MDVGRAGKLWHNMAHKLDQDAEAQKQDDAEREGAGHEEQVFLHGDRMVDSEGGFDFKEPPVYPTVPLGGALGISRHGCDGGYLGSPLCRGARRNENRDKSHENSADDSNRADGEQRRIRKFFTDDEPQHGAEPPCDHNSERDAGRDCGFAPSWRPHGGFRGRFRF